MINSYDHTAAWFLEKIISRDVLERVTNPLAHQIAVTRIGRLELLSPLTAAESSLEGTQRKLEIDLSQTVHIYNILDSIRTLMIHTLC